MELNTEDLHKIHEVLKEMIDEVDRICRKNNICVHGKKSAKRN